jgi:UDP-N-acetylmuramate: L-alanyl-gamma-D-glutamyl-meso-diaminopimelate ligase
MTADRRRTLPDVPSFSDIEKIHIIGICGTAMGSLAAILKELGYRVTGSDAMAYPPMSTWLEARGLEIRDGYHAENIDDDVDLVVVGNVARPDNEEAVATRERGLPALSLPEVLRTLVFPGKDVLCVTGTHGKTTTSSMLAWLLYANDRDPSFFIGGVTRNFDSNYRLGNGKAFVIEGDEYDTAYFDKVPKFWHYPARAATINNVEFDHVDIYPDLDSIRAVFERFASQIPSDGQLWVNGDDEIAVACAKHANSDVHTFGLGPQNDYRATDLTPTADGMQFKIEFMGEAKGVCTIPMPGTYNVRNFLGASALALFAGVPIEASTQVITDFEGIKKRQELVGESRGITVIDDFAHHPTAVRHALAAVRAQYPERRIWALFEAKSNTSRRSTFQDVYPSSFEDADIVVLSPPWKEDKLPDEKRISIPQLVADIETLEKQVTTLPDIEEIVRYVAENAQQGDVIVGLSGSAFGGVHQKILDALR